MSNDNGSDEGTPKGFAVQAATVPPGDKSNIKRPDSIIADAGVAFVERIAKQETEEFAEAAANEITRRKVLACMGGKEPRPALFWESMTCCYDPVSRARIRVWRRSEIMPDELDIELLTVIGHIPGSAEMKDVFDILSTIEGVTAIELVDPKGNGGVKYLEW